MALGELPTANTTTPVVTTPAPTVQPHSCPEGEFVCGAHKECVPLSQVCDFRHDCSDGSDEANCGKTSTKHCQSLRCLSALFFFFFVTFSFYLPAVKERCDFEGGDTCGWTTVNLSLIPAHVFLWSPDQGESIHNGEQFHRPVNDHTL